MIFLKIVLFEVFLLFIYGFFTLFSPLTV